MTSGVRSRSEMWRIALPRGHSPSSLMCGVSDVVAIEMSGELRSTALTSVAISTLTWSKVL